MLPKDNATLAESQAMLDSSKKSEKKSSRFSLKWLLRRTRETKNSPTTNTSTTNATSHDKIHPHNVTMIIPKSKSCDVSLTLRKDPNVIITSEPDKIRSPNVPYMKMVVPRKISACGMPSKAMVTASQVFKTSYSSNDVQNLLTPSVTSTPGPYYNNNNNASTPQPLGGINYNPTSSLTRLRHHHHQPNHQEQPGGSSSSSGCCSTSTQRNSFLSFNKKASFTNLESLATAKLASPDNYSPDSDYNPMECVSSGCCAYIKPDKVYCKSGSIHSNLQSLSGSIYSSSNLLCRLCLMLVPSTDLYTLKECQCVFCRTCIQQYLTINIREGNVALTCPDADCSKKCQISTSEVEQLVDAEIYDMFQRFKLNRDVELDPTRTWCPGVNCETICYVRPSNDSKSKDTGVLVHCPNCRSKFCSMCKDAWHSNKSCDEVRREKHEEGQFLLEQDDDPPIKRCPNCRVPIERDQGCAQMMCKQCKHVFCWYCLTSLDDDFLLRHYDKGPCKNKLGHSRASVVWHRTQVVGIFAGFGFLLLIASPLLLLAAPCLLCCRCKQCTKFFDDDPTAI